MTLMASRIIETNESDESENDSSDNSNNNEEEEEQIEPESDASSDNVDGNTNPGWVDSISKILKTNKPKRKKTLVLSKAKKLTDLKPPKEKPAGYEVLTADGEVKEEKVEINTAVKEEKTDEPPRKKKRELPNLRVKPSILQKDRERTLAKIATRGVVQLFNSVKNQQKEISEKLNAEKLEVRKEKVMKSIDKRQFLDVLMGEKSGVVEEPTVTDKIVDDDNPSWSVLRDDFMVGAKLKDWDKEVEQEAEVEMA